MTINLENPQQSDQKIQPSNQWKFDNPKFASTFPFLNKVLNQEISVENNVKHKVVNSFLNTGIPSLDYYLQKIKPGSVITILGSSGSGKSVLLNNFHEYSNATRYFLDMGTNFNKIMFDHFISLNFNIKLIDWAPHSDVQKNKKYIEKMVSKIRRKKECLVMAKTTNKNVFAFGREFTATPSCYIYSASLILNLSKIPLSESDRSNATHRIEITKNRFSSFCGYVCDVKLKSKPGMGKPLFEQA